MEAADQGRGSYQGVHLPEDLPPALLEAWHNAQDDARRAEALLEIAYHLNHFSAWQAVDMAEHAAAFALRGNDSHLLVRVLLETAIMQSEATRSAEALQNVERGLKVAQSMGEAGVADVLEAIEVRGVIRRNLGDERSARQDFLFVLSHDAGVIDPITLLLAHINLSSLYCDLGQPDLALHLLRLADEQVTGLAQKPPKEWSDTSENHFRFAVLELRSAAYLVQARLHRDKGRESALQTDLAEAAQSLQAASSLVAADDLSRNSMLHAHRAELHLLRGQLTEAGEQAQKAAEFSRQIGQVGSGRPFMVLAQWHAACGNLGAALETYREALGISRKAGAPRWIQYCLGEIALLHERQGDLATALRLTREALHYARELNSTLNELLPLDDPQDAMGATLQDTGLSWQERLRLAEQQAGQDHLTGLLNRRGLEFALVQQKRQLRADDLLMVAMLDIDHFKSVNDQFTHTVGDQVLKIVARLLQDVLRHETLLARYGGEEFIIVSPVESAREAGLLLERCRQAVSAYGWDKLLQGRTLTISAGFAVGQPADFGTLQHRADEALYSAKQGGRNRVYP